MSGEGSIRRLPLFEEMKKEDMGKSYCYLNKLLKGKSSEDFNNLEELLSFEQALPLFEESLRLIVVDSLKMDKEVIKILLSQNEYYIKRIKKCKWFFEKPSTAEFWIEQIFPYVSRTTRINIINQLSKYWKSEKEAEKLVNYLCEEYGGVFGEPLLPLCGRDFVKAFIKRNKKPFSYSTSPRALLNVAKRYPDVAIEVLNIICESSSNNDIYHYKQVFKYIASSQPEIFISFYEKHYSSLSYLYFGNSLTRNMAPKIKNLFFESRLLVNSSLFKNKEFFKSLEFEDKIKFIEALVKFNQSKLTYNSWIEAMYTVNNLLPFVNLKKRLRVIETVFKMVYNSDFKNHPKVWTPHTLELLPTEDRLFFVVKLEELMNESLEKGNECVCHISFGEPEAIVYLYDFETGFEKLKKLMSKAPTISKRETILSYMVTNCALNKTPERIEQLINHVVERHRLDDPSILSDFQDNVINKLLHKTPMSSRVLEKLEEISYLWAVKGYDNNYGSILEKLIISRLDEKLEVGKYMKKFFNFSILDRDLAHAFLYDVKSIHSKNLFFAYCEDIVQWFQANPNNEEKIHNMLSNVVRTCKTYNSNHPKHSIRLVEIPKLEKELRNQLSKSYGSIGGEDWPLDIWDKYHDEIYYTFYTSKLPNYILKKYPETFLKILDKVLDHSEKIYYFDTFFKQLKKFFSFYNLTGKMKEKYLNKLKQGQGKERKMSLKLYSYLATVEEFSQATTEYIPQGEKINKEADPDFTEVQLKVPEVIKNIQPLWKTRDLVLKFFFGDFLRGAVPSLSSCCYFSRVDEIVPFLINLFDKLPPKISLKKDVIRLVGDLARRKEKTEFFLKCWESNTHYSIRSTLMSCTGKSFIDQPTREVFEVMKKFISESDEMAISERPEIKRIPDEYLSEYVSSLWAYSEKKPAKTKIILRSSTLNHFDKSNIKFLSTEFCEKLISENLFKNSPLNVTSFAISYLTCEPKEMNPRTRFVLDLLKNRTSETSLISNFLRDFLSMCLKNVQLFSDIVNAFLSNWPQSLNDKLYNDHFKLQCYQLLCKVLMKYSDVKESKKIIAAEFGNEMKEYVLSINHLNDLAVTLKESITTLLNDLTSKELKLDSMYVVKEFFSAPMNKTLVIIGLSVLPNEIVDLLKSKENVFDPEEKEKKSMITEIVRNLKSLNDEVVNIYLYKRFNNLDEYLSE